MPRIKFIADPKLPRDLAHLGYCKGHEVDLSANQAERWVRRGVAVYLPDALTVKIPALEPIVEVDPAVLKNDAPLDHIQDVVGFDPATADETSLRSFLIERGVTPHHRAGEVKLREMARELLAGGEM